jgi:hypothetical protein
MRDLPPFLHPNFSIKKRQGTDNQLINIKPGHLNAFGWKKKNTNLLNMQSPFRTNEEYLNIQIPVYEDDNQKQTEILEKYDIYPNGLGWEGVISQILEKVDSELLSYIDFDSEGDCFNARFEEKEYFDRFLSVLNPIFTNLSVFEDFVKDVDVEDLDN